MFGRYVSLTVAAFSATATALTLGSPVAHATEADAQFLAVVESLGLQFATPDEAVEAGNNVCDIVAEGSANNINPAEIRTSLVASLLGEGLDVPSATRLMQGAVGAYCPDFQAIVAD